MLTDQDSHERGRQRPRRVEAKEALTLFLVKRSQVDAPGLCQLLNLVAEVVATATDIHPNIAGLRLNFNDYV